MKFKTTIKKGGFTEWQFMSKHTDESSARKALWIAEEKHEQNSRYARGEIFVFRVNKVEK